MSVYRAEKRRFWGEHLDQWKSGGLSQVDYCRRNGINIKSFRYWKRRIGLIGSPLTLVELPISKTLPVSVLPALPQLCLVVGRFRIEIGKGFDAEDLERVVRMLVRI